MDTYSAHSDNTDTTPPTPRKSLWGWAIFGVYTTFALCTIGFVVFAFSQKVELVSDNYYADAVDYEAHLQRTRNATTKEGKVTCLRSDEGKSVVLQFPSVGAQGTITLYRPSHSAMDKKVAIALDAEGKQSINIASLEKGLWRIKIQWQMQATEYYNELSIEV